MDEEISEQEMFLTFCRNLSNPHVERDYHELKAQGVTCFLHTDGEGFKHLLIPSGEQHV